MKENIKKDAEIQRLEILLTPFRTIALERYTGSETEAILKLATRIQELESTVTALKDYSYVAELNPIGLPSLRGKPGEEAFIKITTGIYDILQGTWTEENRQYTYLCDPDSKAKFKEVIQKSPLFPFAYFAMAICLRSEKDENWKTYAQKAIEIFKKTTAINPHDPSHDTALQKLLQLLEE